MGKDWSQQIKKSTLINYEAHTANYEEAGISTGRGHTDTKQHDKVMSTPTQSHSTTVYQHHSNRRLSEGHHAHIGNSGQK
jgi:hypothetical protein